jgi:hypothetical protein
MASGKSEIKAAAKAGPAGAVERESSATLAFGAVSLGVESIAAQMPATPARMLDIIRGKLSKCRVMVAESGIACELNDDKTMLVYKNLAKNLKGAWTLGIPKSGMNGEDLKFIVGRTRSTWVLFFDQPPESLYENPKFMSIDLKKRDVVVLETGKTMYLARVSRQEIDLLNSIAAVANGKAQAPMKDTLAPATDAIPSYSDVSAKLGKAEDVLSEDLIFEMSQFAEGIKFITTLQDEAGHAHYYIISGDEEHAYWLYVNSDPAPPEGSLFKTTFRYKDDSCVLYREG